MGLIDEKPMGIPYGIWVLIFCLSFTALSRVTWIPKLLYKNIEIETFIGFLTDMVIAGISLFIIYGLVKARRWAWFLLLSFIIVDVATAFALSAELGNVIPAFKMIFSIAVFVYLFQPGVKAYFEKA